MLINVHLNMGTSYITGFNIHVSTLKPLCLIQFEPISQSKNYQVVWPASNHFDDQAEVLPRH